MIQLRKTSRDTAIFYFLITLTLLSSIISDNKVPIVTNHNNQIRLQVGDKLRLECPIHITSSGGLVSASALGTTKDGPQSILDEDSSNVMYHWTVRNLPDYSLDLDPRYRFSQQRRVLEVTEPLQTSDSGNYTCMGVTGFGKREVTFEVYIRDPDANLLCATPHQAKQQGLKAPCFIDPALKIHPTLSIEKPMGTRVQLKCEADGTSPIRYRWFMGNSVADWITTSEGVRGPILTIDQVGREHTGQYTCQVSNPAGSLNYTYRLLVTEPPSATPKIISPVQNYTFTTDQSASLIARIQCTCEEPVIQWLKRIEPGEEAMYERLGATKIPLPNARPSEINEVYVVLGSWPDSPSVVDKTTTYFTESTHSSAPSLLIDPNSKHQQTIKDDRPNYYRNKINHLKSLKEQVFVTRLRFQKPTDKQKHEGKYVVMTMSLSDIKSLEYIAIYVTIVPDAAFLKGQRILIYLLVPFGVIFALLGLIAYIFVCRRRKSPEHSISSSNERCILRTAELSPQTYQIMSNYKKTSSVHTSSRQSSNSHQNDTNNIKPVYTLLGIQQQQQQQSQQSQPHNFMQTNNTLIDSQSNKYNQNISSNGSQFNNSLTLTQNTIVPANDARMVANLSDDSSRASGTMVPVMNGNCISNQPHQTHCMLPYPPNMQSMIVPNGTEALQQYPQYYLTQTASSVFSDTNGPPGNYIQPPPPPFSSPMTAASGQVGVGGVINCQVPPSNSTEISFDQYSAISRSPASSGTLTNHYTAPFGEFGKTMDNDNLDVRHHFGQTHYPRA